MERRSQYALVRRYKRTNNLDYVRGKGRHGRLIETTGRHGEDCKKATI